MIFVDSNVFMYAVGGPHANQEPASTFFNDAIRDETPLCTSAEVLQEMVHVYKHENRLVFYDQALSLVHGTIEQVWDLKAEDVAEARSLADQHSSLQSRDLCHLASCRNRGVNAIKTFDDGFAEVVRALGMSSSA